MRGAAFAAEARVAEAVIAATRRRRNPTDDMMSPVEIRPARASDLTSMAEQMKAVADEGVWLATQSDRSIAELEERFRQSFAAEHLLLVLEHDGRVVGALGLHPTGIDDVYSLGMSILKEFRGEGWGRRLIDAGLEAARARGIVKVELEVFPDNPRAIALYVSAGFEIEGYKRNHYPRLDGSRRSAVLMARFL
jgi:ribosomal protein S18 acetylase RimI-like enzyme